MTMARTRRPSARIARARSTSGLVQTRRPPQTPAVGLDAFGGGGDPLGGRDSGVRTTCVIDDHLRRGAGALARSRESCRLGAGRRRGF